MLHNLKKYNSYHKAFQICIPRWIYSAIIHKLINEFSKFIIIFLSRPVPHNDSDIGADSCCGATLSSLPLSQSLLGDIISVVVVFATPSPREEFQPEKLLLMTQRIG